MRKLSTEEGDRRVQRSREALYSAFVALVVAKGYARVSVVEILREADVGRSTFYEHFSSKRALLEYGFERLRRNLLKADSSVPFGFVVGLLDHTRRHIGLYRALLLDNSGPLAERQMRLTIEPIVARDLSAFWPAAHRPTVASFVSGALLRTLETAIQDGSLGGEEIRGMLQSTAEALARKSAGE